MLSWSAGIIILIAKLLLVLVALLLMAAYLVYAERRLLARFQIRLGPNRAGPWGLLQPLADIIKLLTKEDIVPAAADRVIFRLAPAVAAGTALLIFAVVPFGAGWQLGGRPIPGVIADLNVGLLLVLALSSLGVYSVALGGWASNSKYSLLGGIRGAAQMISYELVLGLALAPVVMQAGSFSLVEVVEAQARYPFLLAQPLSFLLFMAGGMAEIKRIPFDLPEAENELVAGYHTEYSGMRFGLYFLGEYVTLVVLGGAGRGLFSGGLAGAVAAAAGLVLYQSGAGGLRHDLDPGGPAPAALRPADALLLAGPDPPGPGERHGHRRDAPLGLGLKK